MALIITIFEIMVMMGIIKKKRKILGCVISYHVSEY